MTTGTIHASERKLRGVTSTLRYVSRVAKRDQGCVPLTRAKPRGLDHSGIDAGSGNRRERGHFQRRPRRLAAPTREPR